jgi:MtN3 and saliva related transmembrane protein
MEISYILGITGSILVTVAYIPQTVKTIKTRHTKDLSLYWLVILTIGLWLYFVYGIAINSTPVMISSGAGGVLVAILTVYKLIYK